MRHDKKLAVLLMDIDHFKHVNDRYGHPAGDEVLRRLAATVETMIRVEDVFARHGGEEFAALARGIPPSGAVRFAERIRASMEQMKTVFQGHSTPGTQWRWSPRQQGATASLAR